MPRKMLINVDHCNEFLKSFVDPVSCAAFDTIMAHADDNATQEFITGLKATALVNPPANSDVKSHTQFLMAGMLLGTLLARASDSASFDIVLESIRKIESGKIKSITLAKNWGKS